MEDGSSEWLAPDSVEPDWDFNSQDLIVNSPL